MPCSSDGCAIVACSILTKAKERLNEMEDLVHSHGKVQADRKRHSPLLEAVQDPQFLLFLSAFPFAITLVCMVMASSKSPSLGRTGEKVVSVGPVLLFKGTIQKLLLTHICSILWAFLATGKPGN